MTPDEALAKRDIGALVTAISDGLAICSCINGYACSRPHREPGETEAQALLRRLRASREDPMSSEDDPVSGTYGHTGYEVLQADLDLLIRVVERIVHRAQPVTLEGSARADTHS